MRSRRSLTSLPSAAAAGSVAGTGTCVRARACVRACACVSVSVSVYVCMGVRVRAHTCVRVCARVCERGERTGGWKHCRLLSESCGDRPAAARDQRHQRHIACTAQHTRRAALRHGHIPDAYTRTRLQRAQHMRSCTCAHAHTLQQRAKHTHTRTRAKHTHAHGLSLTARLRLPPAMAAGSRGPPRVQGTVSTKRIPEGVL